MIWINLIAIAALAAGFASGWKLISRRRKPLEVESALLSWREDPPSVFRYDVVQGLAILFHGLAIAVVGVLLIVSVNRVGGSPFSLGFRSPAEEWLKSVVGVADLQTGALSFVSAAIASGMAGYTLGALAAFPIVRWRVRPVLMHLTPDGVVYGNTFFPWSDVGSWRFDDAGRLILLYSRSRTSALVLALRPPDGPTFRAAQERVRARAAQGGGITRPAGRRWLVGSGLMLGILVALIVAFLVYRRPAEWAWFLLAADLVALELGGQLLPAL